MARKKLTSPKARTGADALAEVTEDKPSPKTKGKPAPKKAEKPARAGRAQWFVTTIRIDEEQRAWLLQEAMKRALETGTKPDASEVIRDVLDAARGKA